MERQNKLVIYFVVIVLTLLSGVYSLVEQDGFVWQLISFICFVVTGLEMFGVYDLLVEIDIEKKCE